MIATPTARTTREQGSDGVTVTLMGDLDGHGLAEITRSATTRTFADESGIDAVDLLPLGQYQVAVEPRTLPSNLLPAYDSDAIITPRGCLAFAG
jgi:hypothetical protein